MTTIDLTTHALAILAAAAGTALGAILPHLGAHCSCHLP
jgi:hypothetical protein